MALISDTQIAELIAILLASPEPGCALSPPPCRVGMAHGQVADDSCEHDPVTGNNGQLTVTLAGVNVTRDAATGLKCATMEQRLTVRLVRCVPTVDNSGIAPTPQALEASALALRDDADALVQAVTCCWSVRNLVQLVSLTPVGPNGGCGGWQMEVTLNDGICC